MKRSFFSLTALFLLALPFPAFAQGDSRPFSYTLLDDVFLGYVRDGKVNYEALRKRPAKLNAYLANVTGARPGVFATTNE